MEEDLEEEVDDKNIKVIMRKILLIGKGNDLKDIINILKACIVKLKDKTVRQNDFTDKYDYLYEITKTEKEEFRENVIIKRGEWELLSSEIKKVLMELRSSEKRLNEIINFIKK